MQSSAASLTAFTASQIAAVEWRNQDACVMAGPGSGKTTVLVERYRALVEQHGFEPREILAITFTEKAAANMKAKVAAQFAGRPELRRELENSAWISTIHGFCARLLRENALTAAIDPRFRVLDARESDEMQFDCLNAALDEFMELRREDALELIAALHVPYAVGDLKNAYDAIRSAGKTIAEVRAVPSPVPEAGARELAEVLCRLLEAWGDRITPLQRSHRSELLEWASQLSIEFGVEFPIVLNRVPMDHRPALKQFKEAFQACVVDRYAERFRAMMFDILERFEAIYAERRAAVSSLDFNDLERCAIGLLRSNADVRKRVTAQFRQVMLDEFQDINEQQWALIELVRGDDVFFGVGDVNQSIYGFRHARPEIFHAWRESVRAAGKHSADLLDNFRSREEILRAVESALNAAEGIERRELVAAGSFAEKAGPSLEILKVRGEDRDEAAGREARWIAHRILTMRDRHEFRDFAVLCRNGESMRPILEALGHAGIPYACGRRQSFLLSREGLDITALLHTILNPRDSIALATVLRSPLAGIGDEALLQLRTLASSVTGGLNMVAHDTAKLADFAHEDARKLERFAGNLRRWREEQQVLPLDLLIARALDDCGFEWNENVESFLELARTRGAERSLGRFLRDIEGIREAIGAEPDLSDEDQGNCVQVMTAHAAKGLEFPVVILAAMEKGTRMGSAPVTFTPQHGLGLKWKWGVGKGDRSGIEDSWQARNSQELKSREKEEANRLLYVAMTRAKEHLVLSSSAKIGEKRTSHWTKMIETGLTVAPFETDAEPPALPRMAAHAAEENAPATVARPDVSERHDAAVNVTSLTVFADCPRKYYLQRYLGWGSIGVRRSRFDSADEEAGGEETGGVETGTAVHELLAGKPVSIPAPEALRLAEVFRTSELGLRAAQAPIVEREWEFIADIDGTIVRGTIDLWFEDAEGITIVDYKTDIDVEPARYGPQLALYATALGRAPGKQQGKLPVKAYLHYLRTNHIVETPVDEAAIRDARELIGRLRVAQSFLHFDLNEGEHCRACPFYRGLCPAPVRQ